MDSKRAPCWVTVLVLGAIIAINGGPVVVADGVEPTSPVPFQVRLTSDVGDVEVEYGLVVNHANTIEHNATLIPPPGNYSRGTMIVGMFASLDPKTPGAYEVYATNSTGNIPLANTMRGGAVGHDSGMCLYRWVTTDFRTYQGGACTLWVPSDGLGDIKTITRDDATGLYYLIWWGPGIYNGDVPDGGSPYLMTSTDHGTSWSPPTHVAGLDHYNPNNTTIHTKDDINLLYQPAASGHTGLVDCQLFWQKSAPTPNPPYCDNGGCDKRRVLGSMQADDDTGTTWHYTGFTRLPGVDVDDPPELQFYRMRPSLVPGTGGSRVFAHVLLYAPSPYIGPAYGRQPNDCSLTHQQCHGPHMYEEWWTLAAGASAANMTAWRRPARFTRMAPENAYLFAQPGMVGTGADTQMVWVGSGEVYTLPLHRDVGLWAPANTRVRVPAFDLSRATAATLLFINADAHWGPPLLQGGCDETCAAYVLAELEDADGNVIEGYDRTHFNPIMDANAVNLPLRWNNSTQLPLGHGNVTVKVWFRAAKVYAVYLGDSFNPAF